jgi:hypothetical protein
MVCQYSTRGLVSSGKRQTPSEAAEIEGRGRDTFGGVIAAEVIGGYGPQLEPSEAVSRVANAAKTWRSRTPARLYLYKTLLERLTQHLQDVPPELWQLIQNEHTVIRQRYLPRQRHMAPTDQPHVRDRIRRGEKRS